MHSPLPKSEPFAAGIFSELGTEERAALVAELETRSLKRGDVLVRQGETADALYIVISGRFAVTLEGRREPLTEIGPDQPIGEIASSPAGYARPPSRRCGTAWCCGSTVPTSNASRRGAPASGAR
ncbi:MAG: cyclic nucleotide-binding domain-containing protein [Hyphomicrobium sp.]